MLMKSSTLILNSRELGLNEYWAATLKSLVVDMNASSVPPDDSKGFDTFMFRIPLHSVAPFSWSNSTEGALAMARV